VSHNLQAGLPYVVFQLEIVFVWVWFNSGSSYFVEFLVLVRVDFAKLHSAVIINLVPSSCQSLLNISRRRLQDSVLC
jgi:hypothetical protein